MEIITLQAQGSAQSIIIKKKLNMGARDMKGIKIFIYKSISIYKIMLYTKLLK